MKKILLLNLLQSVTLNRCHQLFNRSIGLDKEEKRNKVINVNSMICKLFYYLTLAVSLSVLF